MTEDSTVDSGGLSAPARSPTVPTAATTNDPDADDFNNSDNPSTAVANATGKPTQTSTVGSVSVSGSNHQQPQRSSLSVQGNGLFNRNSQHSSQSLVDADSSAIDPLSQHIIRRTNTAKSIPSKLLGRASYEAEGRGTDVLNSSKPGSSAWADTAANQKSSKDKKKGVSFLSRIIGNRKKDQPSASEDDASEPDVNHLDTDALSQQIGFIPRFPRPPKYINVRAHFKKEKRFNRVFVAQELDGSDLSPGLSDKGGSKSSTEVHGKHGAGKAVWALGFSKDGKYLAAAGQDSKVRVWAVIASPAHRDSFGSERDEGHEDREPPPLKAPVFTSKPVQVYEGHTGSVLDLSWSKNNFLLSSSMDKTVRLWHVTRPECLCCFKHSDFVPSIQFHPRDDRFFLAGSLDMKFRLWSIPDKSVAFVATVPDMITSVAFTPDGRFSIAGCLNGSCNIYETDRLKLVGQLHVRSARTRKAKASKITGIDTITLPPDDPNGTVKLLITSNDSRIRLYNLGDRTVEAKFRGNENTCSQIRATFSHDGKHVICGSEDRKAYIWPVGAAERDVDRRAVEVFEPQTAMVTAAIMAPPKTKQILGFSEDPIYDICNPPPVTLVNNAQSGNGNERGGGGGNSNGDSMKQAQKSPTYLSRSTHSEGDIFIIADYSGKIKVLRQDCAYQKRRYNTMDAASTISRRLLRRSNSARHSIASSIGKDSAHKTPSERIISWRNSVIRDNNRASTDGSRQGTRTRSPSLRTPRNSGSRRTSFGLPAESRAGSRSDFTVSPPLSVYKSSMDSQRSSQEREEEEEEVTKREENDHRHNRSEIPEIRTTVQDTPDNSNEKESDNNNNNENALWPSSSNDQSYVFWNKMTHDALAASSKKLPSRLSVDNTARPPKAERAMSASTLSSDCTTFNNNDDRHKEVDDGEVLKCHHCLGANFQATKGRNGKQRLICVGCHTPIS